MILNVPCLTLTSPQPQTADSSNGHQDPRMKVDQSNRVRAHQPLGPRTSVNRGPVQGQPRIFASMNTGADFQQEPVALKQGQPRIFSAGNGPDPQQWNANGPQPSPGTMHGYQPQQEPPAIYNNRTGDIKGKGVDRSWVDPAPGFQQQQRQPEMPHDQRDGQVGEPPIRTVYTEARSPAMQYRANLEKGKGKGRVDGSVSLNNLPAEPQSLLPPTHRPPVRRATDPPRPAPLRQNPAGSVNESQQRSMGPRGQSIGHQHILNTNGDTFSSQLNRRQSLYSPVVAVATNVPDTQLLNDPPVPSPRTTRGFGQRSDPTQRAPGRYHSPPTPSSLNTESSPPPTGDHSGGGVNGPSPEPLRMRDPGGQSIGWNVQGSVGSFSTQDRSRKASLASNTSASSDRERDRSPPAVDPRPFQNRPQPLRMDSGQTSPPPTHRQSRERIRAGPPPTNRGSQMDSFYGGERKPHARNEEGENHTDIPEEPEPYFYPLELHLLHPQLLRALLQYMTFYDWCILQGVNKSLRSQLSHVKELKEEILERYLSTIGYSRWVWEEDEPLMISLRVKSNRSSPTIVLTCVYRISTNICVAFRYLHTSMPGSQMATCKHVLPPRRRRRRRSITSKRERCPSPLGHIAESSSDCALKRKLSSPTGV